MLICMFYYYYLQVVWSNSFSLEKPVSEGTCYCVKWDFELCSLTHSDLCTFVFQAAAFQPFFRAHAHLDTRRREPWLLPPAYFSTVRSAIIARYRLLPYWYWLFYDSERTGAPVMRPTWVEFPTDRSTFSEEDQHFIGSALLVHPVAQSSVTVVETHLPGDDQVYCCVDCFFVLAVSLVKDGGLGWGIYPIIIIRIMVFIRSRHNRLISVLWDLKPVRPCPRPKNCQWFQGLCHTHMLYIEMFLVAWS